MKNKTIKNGNKLYTESKQKNIPITEVAHDFSLAHGHRVMYKKLPL